MSGYLSALEQYKVQREDPLHPSWNPDGLLHQLSMNGSLLLTANHDRMWLDAYREIVGDNKVSWEVEREILLSLPAWQVRRALWRASLDWWLAVLSYRKQLSAAMLDRGIESLPEVEVLDAALERTALQLGELAWCARDTDKRKISTVEEKSSRGKSKGQ